MILINPSVLLSTLYFDSIKNNDFPVLVCFTTQYVSANHAVAEKYAVGLYLSAFGGNPELGRLLDWRVVFYFNQNSAPSGITCLFHCPSIDKIH